MQVFSKTDARQNFASLFNAVRYAGKVIGIGRGKIRFGAHRKVLPEVLMVRMPTPEDVEKLKKDPRGFDEAMKEWMMKKIGQEFE
ncbi:MAG: hypothetical protein Q8P95_04000 [bacterium]|nr:hypothetical protein [bacterium]